MNEQPVDPDVINLLSELGGSSASDITPVAAADLPADELRRRMRDAIAAFTRGAAPIPVHSTSDEFVPGRGAKIPVRLYSPQTPTSVVVYLHGGSWIAGGIDTADMATRRLSRDTGAVVVSVDYRMLPEHPFPAPIDDAFDATDWASALRPDLPFLVAGDSAGGTLAACVALRARDEGGPRIDGQVLVYPAIDDDLETPSMLAPDSGPLITRDDLGHYLRHYASHDTALGSPYALPGRATSLKGLPSAVVVIAGHDRLRSAEESYVRRLKDDGVPVTVHLDAGLVHGWLDFAPRVRSADRAFTRLTDTVNDLISGATSSARS